VQTSVQDCSFQRPEGHQGLRSQEIFRQVLKSLHSSPQSRRTRDVGGLLEEPLGNVCEEQTLRGLCIELRMSYYYDNLAAKQRYVEEMLDGRGIVHVHSLSKHQFWRLWEACYGEDMRRFLVSANEGFLNKYAPYYAY